MNYKIKDIFECDLVKNINEKSDLLKTAFQNVNNDAQKLNEDTVIDNCFFGSIYDDSLLSIDYSKLSSTNASIKDPDKNMVNKKKAQVEIL